MKILALTRYDRLGASSRVRIMQYAPSMLDEGVALTISPLFSDRYVEQMQLGVRDWLSVICGYVKRITVLLLSYRFDLLWIEKEALPWLPFFFERIMRSKRLPYVIDYDDAVFHYYDQHANKWVRKLLGGKHPRLIAGAQSVIVGNKYLKDFVSKYTTCEVVEIPSVVDTQKYDSSRCLRPIGDTALSRVKCGWVGQRSTSVYLLPLKELFSELAGAGISDFISIGFDVVPLGLPMSYVAWSESTEVDSLCSLDIGLMPLHDGLFERGKCGYKLIQYMACGLPVIASDIGVNREIVRHGIDGFLVCDIEEWAAAIRQLAADAQLRKSMGQAGRARVNALYSLNGRAPQLIAALKREGGR